MHSIERLTSPIKKAAAAIHKAAAIINRDGVTLYAAQASFFAIISAMPFLSLLISVASLFLPPNLLALLDGYQLSEELLEILGSIVAELQVLPRIPLLSLSVVFALWSASRGISAVHVGLERIYKGENQRGFFLRRLISLLGTLVVIALFVFSALLIMFGDYLGELFRLGKVTDAILTYRVPFMLCFLTAAVTLVYASAARGSRSIACALKHHLPGALLTSLGWVVFSRGYGLYLRLFPRASYIYGSIGAICLLMLWFYFCLIILFLGAEVNRWRMERG